jgi:hypothetical protein
MSSSGLWWADDDDDLIWGLGFEAQLNYCANDVKLLQMQAYWVHEKLNKRGIFERNFF